MTRRIKGSDQYDDPDMFASWNAWKGCAALQDKAGEVREPVAWQCRFKENAEWSECSKEHHDWVKRCPHEFVGYEARELYEAQPAPVVPDGFAIVPVEPTDVMVQAAFRLDLSYMPGQEGADRAAVYRAMIAASQQKGGQHG